MQTVYSPHCFICSTGWRKFTATWWTAWQLSAPLRPMQQPWQMCLLQLTPAATIAMASTVWVREYKLKDFTFYTLQWMCNWNEIHSLQYSVSYSHFTKIFFMDLLSMPYTFQLVKECHELKVLDPTVPLSGIADLPHHSQASWCMLFFFHCTAFTVIKDTLQF